MNDLKGENMEPKTREETYLASISGDDVPTPTPITREEYFLAKIAGKEVTVPEPITRKEHYLSKIAENGGGGSGGNIQLELIGTFTKELAEYTDTSTGETTDTGINVAATDYAWTLVVITCDTAVTTSTEWGMSIGLCGRYFSHTTQTDGTLYTYVEYTKGFSTFSANAMESSSIGQTTYGVNVERGKATVQFTRKCGSSLLKIRGGNYKVEVYGLKSL